jgi:hypothetical protein
LAGIATRQPKTRTKGSDPGERIELTWVGVKKVFAQKNSLRLGGWVRDRAQEFSFY